MSWSFFVGRIIRKSLENHEKSMMDISHCQTKPQRFGARPRAARRSSQNWVPWRRERKGSLTEKAVRFHGDFLGTYLIGSLPEDMSKKQNYGM